MTPVKFTRIIAEELIRDEMEEALDSLTKSFYSPVPLTKEEATQKALLFFEKIRKTPEDLSDYWYSLAPNWDVNIWMEGAEDEELTEDQKDKLLRVTLYEVDPNGTTTDTFYRIYPEAE